MKILGVIPSRMESKRLPGKPLLDINGKSMIQRVYESSILQLLMMK
jgi:3-deoxy-manno-octulosonate cytidylyltransferase (CMP-KDO synthetase)